MHLNIFNFLRLLNCDIFKRIIFINLLTIFIRIFNFISPIVCVIIIIDLLFVIVPLI